MTEFNEGHGYSKLQEFITTLNIKNIIALYDCPELHLLKNNLILQIYQRV